MKTKLTTLVAIVAAYLVTSAAEAQDHPNPPLVAGLNSTATTSAGGFQDKVLTKTSHKNVTFDNMPAYALQRLLPGGLMMYVAIVPGYDLNSPNFESWADGMAGSQVAALTPVGHGAGWPQHNMMLTTSDVWTNSNVASNSVWAFVWIMSETPTNTFNLTNLTCSTSSSDVQSGYPYGTLYSTNNFGGTNQYVFNSHWIGGVWNTNGPQLAMTLYEDPSSGPMGNTPLNMACLMCKQIPFYIGTSNQIGAYIGSWNSNTNFGFGVTFRVYMQCPGNVVQMAQVTMQTLGIPPNPIINQTRWQAPVTLGVGLTYQPERTVTLQYSPTLLYPNWSDIATMNGGDAFQWPMNNCLGTYTNGFWRYSVQQ